MKGAEVGGLHVAENPLGDLGADRHIDRLVKGRESRRKQPHDRDKRKRGNAHGHHNLDQTEAIAAMMQRTKSTAR